MSNEITCSCGWKGDYREYKLKHRLEAHNEKHSFACTCSKKGKRLAAAYRAWAYKFLDGSYNQPTVDGNFLDRVVQTLWWRYLASIEGIYTDQWSRVDTEGSGDAPFKTMVQCDSVEDGLAYTLRHWHKRYPKGVPMDDE